MVSFPVPVDWRKVKRKTNLDCGNTFFVLSFQFNILPKHSVTAEYEHKFLWLELHKRISCAVAYTQ